MFFLRDTCKASPWPALTEISKPLLVCVAKKPGCVRVRCLSVCSLLRLGLEEPCWLKGDPCDGFMVRFAPHFSLRVSAAIVAVSKFSRCYSFPASLSTFKMWKLACFTVLSLAALGILKCHLQPHCYATTPFVPLILPTNILGQYRGPTRFMLLFALATHCWVLQAISYSFSNYRDDACSI